MAEQELVRAYRRTLSSGTVVEVTAHNRTNTDVGTAARKIPGRPPLAASGGTFPLGRSLPDVWVMPDVKKAVKAVKAQDKIRAANAKVQAQASQDADHAKIRARIHVREEAKAQAKVLVAKKYPPPKPKTAKLSANTQKLVGLAHGVVEVEGYKRRTKTGQLERVRAYVRRQKLAGLEAKKGTFSGVGSVGSAKPEAAPEPPPEWRASHRPAGPGEDTGAPMHDLTDTYPNDFYDHPEWYANEPGSEESVAQMFKARGNPEAKITIYRSVPAEFANNPLTPGDWVSTSKVYARGHGKQEKAADDWPVLRYTVKAKDLYTSGDSVNEWGFWGDKPLQGVAVYKGGRNSRIGEVGSGEKGIFTGEQPTRTRFSLEDRISLAESTMEDGLSGKKFGPLPTSRLSEFPDGVWGDDYKAAMRAPREFVQQVLRENGDPDGAAHMRVIRSTYGMEHAQAETDGLSSITVRDEYVSAMALLHETAHVLNRTQEGKGHDEAFTTTLAGLYRRYISDEAAAQFLKILDLSTEAVEQKTDILGRAKARRAAPPAPDSTLQQAVKGANPHFNGFGQRIPDPHHIEGDAGYANNCANAVAAFELRMRGQDVSAKPVVDLDQQNTDTFLARWLKPDGEVLDWSDMTHTGSKKATEDLAKDWGDGARGWVIVQYRYSGGHIFVVVNDGGKVRFYDPQTGSTYSPEDWSSIEKDPDGGDIIYAQQMDDLQVTNPQEMVE